jgi:hypothetical protein
VLVSSSTLPSALPLPRGTYHALPAAARARHGVLKTQKQIDLRRICLDGLKDYGNVEILHDGVDNGVSLGDGGLQDELLFAKLRVHLLKAVDGLLETKLGSAGITAMDTRILTPGSRPGRCPCPRATPRPAGSGPTMSAKLHQNCELETYFVDVVVSGKRTVVNLKRSELPLESVVEDHEARFLLGHLLLLLAHLLLLQAHHVLLIAHLLKQRHGRLDLDPVLQFLAVRAATSDLLHVDFDNVAILHVVLKEVLVSDQRIEDFNGGTYPCRGVLGAKSAAFEEETQLVDRTLNASGVGVHGLTESGHVLQLERDALAAGAVEVNLELAWLDRRRRRHGVRRRSLVGVMLGVAAVVRGDRGAISVCHGGIVRWLLGGSRLESVGECGV